MKTNYESWNKTLVELNNFSCKIEFLQGKMRTAVVNRKSMDMTKYYDFLDKIVGEHKLSLSTITNENRSDILIDLAPMKTSYLQANVI